MHRPLERITEAVSLCLVACYLTESTYKTEVAVAVFAAWMLGLVEGVRIHMAASFFPYLALQFNAFGAFSFPIYACGVVIY